MAREWRRDLTVLVTAFAAHAGVMGFIAARRVPAVATERTEAPRPLEMETDIEVTEGNATANPTPERAPLAPESRRVPTPTSTPTSTPTAARESPSSSPAQIPPLAMVSPDVLGIGSQNPFLTGVPQASAPPPAGEVPHPPDNVAPGAQQSLRDGIHARDHELGLDIGGPVVALAESIARTSVAPLKSSAHFEVIADASGNVTSVALTEATAGWDGWQGVATALAEALRTRPLHVPSSTRGVALTLEVTSDVLLPSGFDPGVDVTILNIPFKKAPPDQKRPRRVEILKIDPKIEQVPADPSLNPGLKVPQYRVTFGSVLSFAFDPSDIGARPQRVVHAHVVGERTL